MPKLTDTQLIVLSKAAGRDDGIAIVPEGLNKAAVAKVAASLVSRKLMREVRSKPGMLVWRDDEEGRGTSLVITRGDGKQSGSKMARTTARRRHGRSRRRRTQAAFSWKALGGDR